MTVGAFMVLVALGSLLTGLSTSIGALIAGGGIVTAVVVAFALAWIPIAVIDFRRCTRETALRAKVEADLDRHMSAERARAHEHDRLSRQVESILADGGPAIVCQPILDIDDRVVVGYEALSRFTDGTRPDQWFAQAAEAGLGVELELAAIANALQYMPTIAANAYLSVNASPDALRDPRLMALIVANDPGRTVVELTEHVAFDDYSGYRRVVGQLHEAGARIAVDDTGSGYGSFRHIVDLKPDIIKVDRALVHRVDRDPARRSLMIALVAFANDMGASLVAEGVERVEEDIALRQWGVRFAQGYLYGRPTTPGQVHGVSMAAAVESGTS